MKTLHHISLAFLLSAGVTHAGWLEKLGLIKSSSTTNQSALAVPASLTQDQMVGGLKEALGNGVGRAISQLGHDGGFLTNLNVKIPMPEKLRTVEKTLRLLKQDKLADNFVNSMNHAAEQAVPEAAGVFTDSIKQMTFADAKGILTGTNNAATEYFRRTTQTNLFTKFHPIVQKATSTVGVTSYYKQMTASMTSSNAIGGLLGATGLIKTEDLDVDKYVTNKALDGLFKMIAEEEKRIRENPVARTSELLQKVFGAISK